MLLSVVIVVCLTYQLVMAQESPPVPAIEIKPEENHVLVGGVAEFTCTVTGRVKQNTDIRWQYYHESDLSVTWEYSATSLMAIIYPNNPTIFENVNISVHHSSSNEEVFTLKIRNVTNDGKIFCIYYAGPAAGYSVLDKSPLVVWRKPLNNPECKFAGDIPEIIIDTDRYYNIKLTCSLDDGSPNPELFWYITTDEGGLDKIKGPSNNSITVDRDISVSDLGRAFLCHAVIAATPNNPLTCSIIPYNPTPKISIKHVKTEEYGEEDTIVIFCNNTGASSSNTTYFWYMDGRMLSTTPDESISITQSSTNSTLVISNSLLSSNPAEITCEGVIPMTARANKSLTITIDAITQPRSELLSIVIIAAAAAGGSFLIIIIVLLICYYKHTRSKKANGGTATEGAMTLEESEAGSPRNTSNDQVNHGDDAMIASTPRKERGHSNNHYSLEPSVSSKPGEGEIPVYALPNKNKTLQSQSDQDKNKDASPSLYDDVNVPKSNDDTISNKDAVQREDKAKRNAEGLTYADIAITSSATGNDVSSDDIIRTESATVYSEVKM